MKEGDTSASPGAGSRAMDGRVTVRAESADGRVTMQRSKPGFGDGDEVRSGIIKKIGEELFFVLEGAGIHKGKLGFRCRPDRAVEAASDVRSGVPGGAAM